MRERRITVTNELGLHARAAAQLVRKAREFSSTIVLRRPDTGESANAKSILGLLYLSAAKGVVIEITVEGEDEAAAFEAVTELFEKRFGEIRSYGS